MPGLFEQFPHTNLHELNLDWIIDMLNQFKEELENSAVLSVNGETGHVTLYESENVILPPLPEGIDQWRLVRMMDGQYVGILFYNDHAYIQRGNSTMRLLTQEDIPSSSGVVSWNGLAGVVNVTGQDIPVDNSADADSIEQAITTEITERTNEDNAIRNQLTAMSNILATINDKLNNEPWFQPGDTYTSGSDWVTIPGIVSNSSLTVELGLPLYKKIGSNRSVNITTLQGLIAKPTGGSMHGGNVNYLTKSDCTVSSKIANSNILIIEIAFNAAVDVINNSPVVFKGQIVFNVT